MKRADLEHILRVSKGVTGESDLKFVAALFRHKLIRVSRLTRLIEGVADPSLRERLAEALVVCRQR
jgi:hypothetical protein